MRSRFVSGILALGLVAVGLQARGDETLGMGVLLAEATPIQKLYQHPEQFVGQTVRVDGVVSAVCEEMGCWMALADIVDGTKVVRFKVGHEAGIVFPVSARGKAGAAEGVFEKISAADAEANQAAAEHATHASGPSVEFGRKYQIKATGAVIR